MKRFLLSTTLAMLSVSFGEQMTKGGEKMMTSAVRPAVVAAAEERVKDIAAGSYMIQSMHPGPAQGKFLARAKEKGREAERCWVSTVFMTSVLGYLPCGITIGVLYGMGWGFLAAIGTLLSGGLVAPLVAIPLLLLINSNTVVLSSTRKDIWQIATDASTGDPSSFQLSLPVAADDTNNGSKLSLSSKRKIMKLSKESQVKYSAIAVEGRDDVYLKVTLAENKVKWLCPKGKKLLKLRSRQKCLWKLIPTSTRRQ